MDWPRVEWVSKSVKEEKLEKLWIVDTVKPVLSGHSKIDKMKVLKTGCSLMQV